MPDFNCLAPLEKKLLKNLTEAQATNQLVVALSGGLDSKVLLHALVQLRKKSRLIIFKQFMLITVFR